MDNPAPLPIGIEDYAEMVSSYYYVDKSLFIRDLLEFRTKVNLITRPRRFGKTLNLSMLKYYFEDTGNEELNEERKRLFADKLIAKAGEKYRKEMCSRPVISLSLKSAKQAAWNESFAELASTVSDEFLRHEHIVIPRLTERDRIQYTRFCDRTAEDREYNTCLKFLSRCLYIAYGKRVIILIDEYDAPLENSYAKGFYQESVSFIKSLFESALKTNDYLEFAVLTGCLRVSKESIFTGLNHFKVFTVLNAPFSQYFGFLEEEVPPIMTAYHQEISFERVREWYNGYRFGSENVYNPWSVLGFIYDLTHEETVFPKPYWINTSSNDIIREMVREADPRRKEEIESLINGGFVEAVLHEEITYDGIKETADNLWNFLLFTGYLKQADIFQKPSDFNIYLKLCIPNTEVLTIYVNTIQTWLNDLTRTNDNALLYQALINGDAQVIQDELNKVLFASISYNDYSAEGFYHGFMVGILSEFAGYSVVSNHEAGNGRPDILLRTIARRDKAIVLEFKRAAEISDVKRKMSEAIEQIHTRKYAEGLMAELFQEVISYGIVFYKKECFVERAISAG
ncbi:MAG: ATP-binding protein [Clostridiales bacterium]|jgi:hypothetical protein|nr:ATP-binding protein [Clostridiales bacterium]